MKKAKRILTVILAICLTFSMVPAVSAAEEIKNPAISFNDWDEYVEEMRRKNYGANSDTLPEGYDQSVIDAINNNIDNSVPVESNISLESVIESISTSVVGTGIGETASVQNTARDSVSAMPDGITAPAISKPYNMAAGAGDSTSISTGALSYQKNLLALPGRNGLDLNISIKYNSGESVITESSYKSNENTDTINFNRFAVGWSFGFPYVAGNEYYGFDAHEMLYLPDGTSYKIDYSGDFASGLVNYSLQDIKFEKTENEYILSYENGRKDYFDLTYGTITKTQDRFGNEIIYEYKDEICYQNSFFDYVFRFNTSKKTIHTLLKITDSTGKEINFVYGFTNTNFDRRISSVSLVMDGHTYATINLDRKNNYNGKVDVVESITDAIGLTTYFEYDEKMVNYITQASLEAEKQYVAYGGAFLLNKIILPTTGEISYEYEKARHNYEYAVYDLDYVSHVAVTDWYEVFKVSSRTDSGGTVTYYDYEGDFSGYPYTTDNYIYRTTVTQNNMSTLYTFNNDGDKISEETYSTNSGIRQMPNKSGSTKSVVINGKIYVVSTENEFLSTYTYENTAESYQEKTFEPIEFEYSQFAEIKTHGDCIYAFTTLGSSQYVHKFDTSASSPKWEYDEDDDLYALAGQHYKIGDIKYNEDSGVFYRFYRLYNQYDVYCWEYNPTTETVVNRSVRFSWAEMEDLKLLCINGETSYFTDGEYIYECVISGLEMSCTKKVFDIIPTSGITIGNGSTAQIYMLVGETVYSFDYASKTAVQLMQLTDAENITVGTDNKIHYVTTIDIDPDEDRTVNRKVLMSYDVTVAGSEPELEYFCFSNNDSYTLMTTYGGIFVKSNDRFELTSNTGTNQTRIRTDYTYNGNHLVSSYTKSVSQGAQYKYQGGETYTYIQYRRHPERHTDILGNTTTYTYDETYYLPLTTTQYANRGDNAIVTTNVLSDDKKKVVTSTTVYDGATYVTQNTYDDTNEDGYPGNILKTIVTETTDNAQISETDYTYDTNGNFVISQTANDIVTNTNQFGNRQSIDLTTSFTYNDFGQVLTETNAKGQTTTYRYNKNGWQTKVTYPDGTFVATDYDIGNTNKVTTNYNNEYSTADYFDSMGRATKQTKKVGSGSEKTIAQYSYYLGRVESVTDGTKADYYVYDNFDRVKRVNHGNPTGTSYYSQVTYDDLNLKSTVTLSNYQTTTTYYDIAGRVIKEELGTSAKAVTTYTYDYMGNVTETIDPNGNKTTNIYNDRGQLTQVKNALLQDTKYTYDAYGNIAIVTTPDESELHYEYDNAGRLLTTTNALGAAEHFAYDTLGNLIAQKDRKNQVTTYTYDNMNRPLSKATDNTSTTGNLSTSYTYDTLGNVLTMTDGTGVTSYDYTGDGLLTGITTPDNESISYTYNDAGYLTGVTDYSGYNYTYSYGGTGDVTGIIQKQNGTTVSSMSMFYNYPGVLNGWMINHSTDGATDKFYYYDDKGRVTKIDSGMFDFVGNENYYIQQNYVFDPVGNITQETSTTDGTTNYTYDSLNRIASETAGTTSTAYSYDANNNIIQKLVTTSGVAVSRNYIYDAANRLTDYNVKTASGNTTHTRTYAYDANGNMTGQTRNGSTNIGYDYDAWNRLTKYTSADGVETTYTYNGDNRRTSKTTGNTTINYYWDRDYVSMETVGNVTNTNFVTPMGIVSRTQDEDYTFLIRDAHGDVVETFTNGVRDTYSYDAYGNEKTPDNTDDNPLRYCGEYYDTESGLIYLRNRYYDPDLGRFINEDPIQDGLNWYAYCGNNPVMYVDPSGLDWFLLRDAVESLPSSSVSWDSSTSTATINIGGMTASFQDGTEGVKINSNGKMEVHSDTFAAAFMPSNGERIFLGSHSVLGVGNHAGVIVMVDSRSTFWNDDRFAGSDKTLFGGGIRFATIGAGPSDDNARTNTLKAQYDYDVAIIKGNGGRLRLEGLTGGSVSALFGRTEYFIANHNSGDGAYEYFGTPRVNSNHFNSNSFAHGLLLAAGVTPPQKSSLAIGGFPGWDGGPRLKSLGVFGN